MSAGAYLATIRAVESLYESVVTDPDGWGEQAFADWANDTLGETGELSRDARKHVRRSLRAAQKLQEFWGTGRSSVSDHDDWHTKVDIALGVRAWRPLLDLAQIGLDEWPDAELFEQVKERFAVVTHDRWMEGIDFEQWRANR